MIRTADLTAEDVAAAVALTEQHPDAAADLLRTAQQTAAAILPPHDADDAASAAAILAAPAALAACQREATMDDRKPADDYRPHVRSIVRTLARRAADDDAAPLDDDALAALDALAADPYAAHAGSAPHSVAPDPASRYRWTDADTLATIDRAAPGRKSAALSAAAFMAHDDAAREKDAADALADALAALDTLDGPERLDGLIAAEALRKASAGINRHRQTGRIAAALDAAHAVQLLPAIFHERDTTEPAPADLPPAPRWTPRPKVKTATPDLPTGTPTSGPASLAVAWTPTDDPGTVLARVSLTPTDAQRDAEKALRAALTAARAAGDPDATAEAREALTAHQRATRWTPPRTMTREQVSQYGRALLLDAHARTPDDRRDDATAAALEGPGPVQKPSGRNRPRVGNTGPTVPARLSR